LDETGIFFIVIWIQPIFWMVLFNFKTDRLDRLFKPFAICLLITTAAIEFIPSLNTLVYNMFASAKLVFLYSLLGCVFTWYLMNVKEWHLPQALSISALVVNIGSYYWEAPYIIRNAILVGFEWDWFLHVMVIFLVWYVRNSVGWTPNKRKLVYLTSIGLIISTVIMIIDPIPLGVIVATKWNAPLYLLNRTVCSTIIFVLINKDKIEEDEVKGIVV